MKKRSVPGVIGHTVFAMTDGIMDTAATVLRTVLKILGSAFIVLLLSGMLFSCVFAYYVKTCLAPELDVSLEDYRINQSSTIWFDDGSGIYKELVTLTGKENRERGDYEKMPKYME